MRNDFTACGHEVDNKSFGIGAAAAVVLTAVGVGIFKGGKWAVKKVKESFAEKSAKKAEAKEVKEEAK